MEIHTQFFLMRIVVAGEFSLNGGDEFMPHGRIDASEHDPVLHVLGVSRTQWSLGEEDIMVAIKE